MSDPIYDALQQAAFVGGGPAVAYRIPEDAQIQLSDRPGRHPLEGAAIAYFPEAER